MELNDKEFDAAFRKKVFDAEPQFEEAAWNKMEQKLKKRDRVVFFRKAAVLSLFLLIAFGGYYALFKPEAELIKPVIVKENMNSPARETEVKESAKSETGAGQMLDHPANQLGKRGAGYVFVDQSKIIAGSPVAVPVIVKDSISVKSNIPSVSVLPEVIAKEANVVASNGSDIEPAAIASVVNKKNSKPRKPLPLSLSLSIGPEFNSSSALIGGKKGFSAGLGLSLGIAKRIKLQTGLKYSIKDYGTEGYDYAFANENAKWIVSHVDASCAVLEIPLQASLTVMDDHYRSIDLNAGMSSYFMLKEDYTFKYTAESGYQDRMQEFRNKNQHYFGVIDISATYYMKLKKEKVSIGLEPYVKIPITGVGEGKVNLKSSGVALKLRYDLGKNSK